MNTNTSCTLINEYQNQVTKQAEYHFTYLEKAFWEPRKAVNVILSGTEGVDALRVYIPFLVETNGKTYLPPKEYEALPPLEVEEYFTLNPSHTRIIKGTVSGNVKEIIKLDECFTVTKVDTQDYGRKAMRHWEVGAK